MEEYQEPVIPPKGMGDLMSKFKVAKKKAVKGVYTPNQELAVELANFYKEPKKIGFWLGIIKNYGAETVRMQWKGMADSTAPDSPRLLLFMLKKKRKQYAEQRNPHNVDGKISWSQDRPATK